MKRACAPWSAAQRRACHSGEKTAKGQQIDRDGSSTCQAISATGGTISAEPVQPMRPSASAGPSTRTQSGRYSSRAAARARLDPGP